MMNTYLTYGIIAVLLLVLELAYFRIADRFNIIDKPNERSSHKRVVLRGGGVVFLLGAWIYACFFGLEYFWFLIGLTLIGGISFIDDVRSLPDSVRLVAQFAAMALMFVQLDVWSFGMELGGVGLAVAFCLLALVVCTGIINVYNFMDGINGITGGYSIAVLLPLLWLNMRVGFVENGLIVTTLLAALVFCFFNFRKQAKCFAGDVGSVSMAFILLFLIGNLVLKTGQLWYFVFLIVYGVDACLTIVHRILLHESLGEAHRKHLYQLMANELKVPHVVVSALYAGLQLAISAVALGVGERFGNAGAWVCLVAVLGVLCGVYVWFMKRHFYKHQRYLSAKAIQKEQLSYA